MTRAPLRPCAEPGCPTLGAGARCPTHTRRLPDNRPSAAARGYGPAWRCRRADFLAANPTCCEPGCGRPATEADHDPVTRAQLVAQGVADPDAHQHLRPRCKPHHSSRTARTSSGWSRRAET